MNSKYNSYFFNEFYENNGGGNYMDREQWTPLFNKIADEIIELYNPKTVLDAGCAMGYLVEALRDRGVEAYGFDISEYTIARVREDIKPYCFVHSIDEALPENIPQKFDLIITIEVLEHLYPEKGKEAIQNLCNYTNTIIFTSTPDDIEDCTHVNVQLLEYWARIFADNSFYRNLVTDVSFICPWAVVFEKRRDIENIIYEYEMKLRIDIDSLKQNKLSSKIYYDLGDGFNESHTYKYNDCIKNNHLDLKVESIENYKSIRIDPIEAAICILKNLRIINSNGNTIQYLTNGFHIGNYLLFNNADPNITIQFNEKDSGYIKVTADILVINEIEYIDIFDKLLEYSKTTLYINQIEDHNKKLQETNDKLINEKNALENRFHALIESNNSILEQSRVDICKFSDKVSQLEDKIDNTFNYNNYLKGIIETLKHENEELENKNGELENKNNQLEKEKIYFIEHHHAALVEKDAVREELTLVYTSKSWKILNIFKQIKNKFKKKNKIELSNFYYGIDCLEINNDVLNVVGWVFNSNNLIEDLKVKLISNRNEYSVDVKDRIIRDDVYNVYKNENAKNSGFSIKCSISNYKKLKIYIECTVNGKVSLILLNKINNPLRKRINLFIKKINKRNIKTALTLLKDGEIKEIRNILDFKISTTSDVSTPRENIIELIEKNVNDLYINSDENNEEIDIIVPVYNGYDYFEALFNSVKRTKMKYRLIIINDKSTDSRIAPFLDNLRKKENNVIVLENEENLGFVKTVNKGLKFSTNHIVLLNTDVELPEYWLERLMAPILLDNSVATTTPFTTCGTICSFPNFCEDNVIFENLDVNSIDSQFQRINPTFEIIPTGVGFCMSMSRDAIKSVGLLDDDTFIRGYGEENDWCQRAIKAGFKNVHVENLFVYHKHGGSFMSSEKKELLEKNKKLLLKKHPNYDIDVAKYCEKDPVKKIRDLMIMAISCNIVENKVVFAFDHNIGGGASAYLNNKVKAIISEGNSIFICKYDIGRNNYTLDYYFKDYKLAYYFNNIEEVLQIFDIFHINKIWINELVTYPNLYNLFDIILKIKESKDISLTFLLHDFYSICPSTNLINYKGEYCGIPNISDCEKCIVNNMKFNNYLQYESMSVWRIKWKKLLENCDEIIGFSNNSISLLKKSYGDLPNIKLIPHQVNYLVDLNHKYKVTKTLNIGLLGVLSEHKGVKIIKELLNIIESRNLNINIILIGESMEKMESNHFIQTGKYKPEEIPKLVLSYDIDIFFITSIWPETFSYTTEEAMKMGYPVAVFDIGAPAERVGEYKKGIIIPKIDASVALDCILNYYKNSYSELISMVDKKEVLFIAEYISFSSRYRVEHFIEQLLTLGIVSKFIETKDLNNVDLNMYQSVVIYRCSITDSIREFVEKCHRYNIKVFYDIDDFIFNYDKIKSLEFLKHPEYKDFENYSHNIFECMKLCDGFLTSTKHMKDAISADFPNIPVCVNRNVASLEMLTLSLRAIEDKESNKERIVLGYFSGSNTHNADFVIISQALIEIMEKYPNVYLKTGGCLEIDEQFNKYSNRLEHFDFMDWRNLPKEIASIDINLMPLENTFFHACKSENKWTEAALVKVPTVASYNDELALVINDGVDGYLCKNREEWLKALVILIENKELRQKVASKAHERVLKSYVTNNSGSEAKNFILRS